MRGSSRYTRTRASIRDRLDTRIPASRRRCSWRLIAGRLSPSSAPKLDGRLGATASAATIRRLVGSARRSMPAPLRFGISRACVRPLYCHSIGSRTRPVELDRTRAARSRPAMERPRRSAFSTMVPLDRNHRKTGGASDLFDHGNLALASGPIAGRDPRPRTRRAHRSSRWRASRWRAHHLVRWARRARPLGLRRHRRVGRR
jgi:hypothetical protein